MQEHLLLIPLSRKPSCAKKKLRTLAKVKQMLDLRLENDRDSSRRSGFR
jgi:hypothetical protein